MQIQYINSLNTQIQLFGKLNIEELIAFVSEIVNKGTDIIKKNNF